MNPVLALTTRVGGGPRVMFPIPPRYRQPEVERLRAELADGSFRPVIDRHYPLDDIVEAYRYVETGEKIGNVVIDVAPGGGD
jgi:NADPH:quinone reductase-like Zn-dependent oxidoreductase